MLGDRRVHSSHLSGTGHSARNGRTVLLFCCRIKEARIPKSRGGGASAEYEERMMGK